MSIGQGKLLTIDIARYKFYKRLPWLGIENYVSRLSNIKIYFLSFYCNTVCKNVSCDMGLIVIQKYQLGGGLKQLILHQKFWTCGLATEMLQKVNIVKTRGDEDQYFII